MGAKCSRSRKCKLVLVCHLDPARLKRAFGQLHSQPFEHLVLRPGIKLGEHRQTSDPKQHWCVTWEAKLIACEVALWQSLLHSSNLNRQRNDRELRTMRLRIDKIKTKTTLELVKTGIKQLTGYGSSSNGAANQGVPRTQGVIREHQGGQD